MSRRRLLGVVAGGAAVAAAGLGASTVVGRSEAATAPAAAAEIPFHGEHQAGITTHPQDQLYVMAYDVVTTDPREIALLMQRWTDAARLLTTGKPVGPGGAVKGNRLAPPDDTGEVLGLPAAGLTLTVGLRPVAVRPPVRLRHPAPAAPRAAAALRRRRARPRDQQRRHRDPGVRQRRAGRRARRAPAHPARRRRREPAVGAARLRADVRSRPRAAARRATCRASRTARTTSTSSTRR